jgi:hypothetical protein
MVFYDNGLPLNKKVDFQKIKSLHRRACYQLKYDVREFLESGWVVEVTLRNRESELTNLVDFLNAPMKTIEPWFLHNIQAELKVHQKFLNIVDNLLFEFGMPFFPILDITEDLFFQATKRYPEKEAKLFEFSRELGFATCFEKLGKNYETWSVVTVLLGAGIVWASENEDDPWYMGPEIQVLIDMLQQDL